MIRKSLNKSAYLLTAYLWLTASTCLAEESAFLCKKIDEPVTFVFSATSVMSKDAEGNYGEPTDVTFGYSPDGKHRVWTTSDELIRFVLMNGQIFVMANSGKVVGKIICS
ncbi:MAG: hypothetical protein V7742_21585 [Halioglobus sp.]